jgi:hypothetical protein
MERLSRKILKVPYKRSIHRCLQSYQGYADPLVGVKGLVVTVNTLYLK